MKEHNGHHHGATAAVPVDDLVNNDLTIRASFGYTSDAWRDVVRLLNAGRLSRAATTDPLALWAYLYATGGRQQPFVFHNNDLPGIMLGNGVLRLARLHGVRAGRRAVILTNCDDGHVLAEQLELLGVRRR